MFGYLAALSENASRLGARKKHETARPSAAEGARHVRRSYVAAITLAHALACLAFLPWFFSWTGVVLAVAGFYVFGFLGINVGYHRLLTHRSFSCPRWLECTFVLLGVCCVLDSPLNWAAVHRYHHQFADRDSDPHSPLASRLWGYIGWVVVEQDERDAKQLFDRYAKDLIQDPFYVWLDRRGNWLKVALISWLLFFAAGEAVESIKSASQLDAFQFGLSLMIWGALVRTVLVLQSSWFSNMALHLWGYRNYDTVDNSRNNMWIVIITNGEGWHNNHHADPRSAKHGHKWWEFDLTWLWIRLLMLLGLARDVTLPSRRLVELFDPDGRRRKVDEMSAALNRL
jgi:sn-1 stearoyl-lipid 9-desaturase